MYTCPADERQIRDVECGQRSEAVVPLPEGGSLLAGETVLFALSNSRPGEPPNFVKGGDSIQVALTGVTDLGTIDPTSGQALVRIAWAPLGRFEPPEPTPRRGPWSRRANNAAVALRTPDGATVPPSLLTDPCGPIAAPPGTHTPGGRN